MIKLYLFCLSVRLSGYLSVSCLLLLPVTTHPVPCCCCLYSLFSPISLSLSHLLFCLYLPMVSSLSTLSLSLPLSGTADGDYGPVLPFVLGPQRDLWLFGQHTARLPYSSIPARWAPELLSSPLSCLLTSLFSCPLSLPCHIEPASKECEGDPGQPDGPHAGLLQEELCQPLRCQPGQCRTTPGIKCVECQL